MSQRRDSAITVCDSGMGMSFLARAAALQSVFSNSKQEKATFAKLSPSSSLAKPNWGLNLVLIWLPPAPTQLLLTRC